mmetsp:Transcript_46508/g.88797  ORF Transcript_46508/g.88797 Transcript_46508/m.88797 type:complete len:200 (-) Transcript_46508:37-636(-)
MSMKRSDRLRGYDNSGNSPGISILRRPPTRIPSTASSKAGMTSLLPMVKTKGSSRTEVLSMRLPWYPEVYPDQCTTTTSPASGMAPFPSLASNTFRPEGVVMNSWLDESTLACAEPALSEDARPNAASPSKSRRPRVHASIGFDPALTTKHVLSMPWARLYRHPCRVAYVRVRSFEVRNFIGKARAATLITLEAMCALR